MNNNEYTSNMTVNESNIFEMQSSHKNSTFNKIPTLQQTRRVVTLGNHIVNENAVDGTFKKSTGILMDNPDKISKINVINKKAMTELENTGEADNSISETYAGILKGEEFIKLKQRGSIVTSRKASIFLSPSVPAMLGTASHEIRRKTLRLEEPETLPERLESPMETLPSKMEGSENIAVRSMQMEVPSIDSFTPLEAAAISCVLEECLEQLATIRFIIPAHLDPRWDDTFKTIDEMYGVPDEPRTIFREDMGLLPLIPNAAEKLQRERNYIYQVLEKVLHDVRDNRRFDSLQEEIDNIAKKQEGERNLKANTQIWFSQAKQLRELLTSDKERNENDRKRKIKLAQESDAQVDHTIFLNSEKLGYAEKWERARLEQQELRLELQKTDLLNKLNNYSQEYNAEQMISEQVNAYLEADIKDKEEQIIIWTKRYNEELVQLQQEIDKQKKNIEEQKLELENMRALKDERQKIIDEYMAEEKKLQEEAKIHKKLNQAATVIQSVWRGYMMRHQLGKYKYLRKLLKRRKMKKGTLRKKPK